MSRMPRRLFLVGQEAVDVARLTGLHLGILESRKWLPLVHPNAVTEDGLEAVYLDLTRIEYWEKLRVAWARIGAHYYLKNNPKEG